MIGDAGSLERIHYQFDLCFPTLMSDSAAVRQNAFVGYFRPVYVSWRARRRVRVYWLAPILSVAAYIVAILWGAGNIVDRTTSIFEYTVLNATPLAFLAMGAGVVLATGGVDLSVAGLATITGVVFALLTHLGMSLLVSALLTLLFGSFGGFFLGVLVAKSFPALITSWALGSLWFVVGLVACTFASSNGLSNAEVTGIGLPFLGRDHLSSEGCVFLVGAVAITLNLTNLPRQAKAVGANRASAAYAGVRPTKVIRAAYTISGALAAFCGIFQALLNSTASTGDLQGRELVAIATAVLGGTLMTGGYLSLGSIACAAALWKLLEMLAFTVRIPIASDYQQRVVSSGFAIVILALAYFAARAEEGRFVPGLIDPKSTDHWTRRRR